MLSKDLPAGSPPPHRVGRSSRRAREMMRCPARCTCFAFLRSSSTPVWSGGFSSAFPRPRCSSLRTQVCRWTDRCSFGRKRRDGLASSVALFRSSSFVRFWLPRFGVPDKARARRFRHCPDFRRRGRCSTSFLISFTNAAATEAFAPLHRAFRSERGFPSGTSSTLTRRPFEVLLPLKVPPLRDFAC